MLQQARSMTDDPEELVHEVILKLVPKVGTIKSLKDYAFISMKRASWQKPKHLELEPLPLMVDDLVLLREELDRYVRHLPKVERLIFSAIYEHGVSTKALASCLGVSIRSAQAYVKQVREAVTNGITEDHAPR
jgi:DNA-directed RNA polymerase specialized sigma24 family protein